MGQIIDNFQEEMQSKQRALTCATFFRYLRSSGGRPILVYRICFEKLFYPAVYLEMELHHLDLQTITQRVECFREIILNDVNGSLVSYAVE